MIRERDRLAEIERRIEERINPTMLLAGEKAVEDWSEIDTPASLAKKVYIAMVVASRDC